MTRLRQISTAAGTLGCAVAIGFVMQSGSQAGQSDQVIVAQSLPVDAANTMLDVEEIKLTSGEFTPPEETLGVDMPLAETEVIKASAPAALPTPDVSHAAPTPGCEMTAQARPIAAAMVQLTLDAVCLPNERVTVHHNGMVFSQTTSASGTLDITVPALAQEAMFVMAFTSGEGAVAQTTVEELADFDRLVLQWKGDTGFEIHAREFGADYGETGHKWKDAPGELVDAVTGAGGFITRYGDVTAPEALLAEVYSFPITGSAQSGIVDLTVETEVSDVNCGLEIEAQSLAVLAGSEMKTRNLTLSVPECDAAGNFLVLNNLLQDLKVAAN